MNRLLVIAAVCTLGLGVGTPPVQADAIPAPTGPVILTITGDIAVFNTADALQFDRETFADLEARTIQTSTIWTEGHRSFQGVSLHTLTDLLGIDSGTLLATAINDYTIEIPVTDAVPDGPIIAYLLDGEEMSVREKGPLWVIYPYDSSPKYRTAVIHSRSIWQLDRIDVVK